MKKIKSVKLKNDYRSGHSYMEKGTSLFWDIDDNKWKINGIGKWHEQEILNNKTDLFEIEYEEERKYIDVRIEYYDDSILGDFDMGYFQTFKEFLNRRCSTERKVELTIIGKGKL